MSWREDKLAKKKMNPKTQAIFLEGLRRYQEQGVHILLDGKEADIEDLRVIFEEQSDGGFYMGDYVLEDNSMEKGGTDARAKVKAHQAEYTEKRKGKRRGELKEIRFDRVYNR